ncbi:MAG: hypothetical protein R2867_39815 [Caldilineaceae bacterium]
MLYLAAWGPTQADRAPRPRNSSYGAGCGKWAAVVPLLHFWLAWPLLALQIHC